MSIELRCPNCQHFVLSLITGCKGLARVVCRRCRRRLVLDLALADVRLLRAVEPALPAAEDKGERP